MTLGFKRLTAIGVLSRW